MPAGAYQCGRVAHVSAEKTTAPHGGRCIQIPLSYSLNHLRVADSQAVALTIQEALERAAP
jgi:hypothetical protein